MKAFIKGIGNISPQQTWNDETVLMQAFDYRGDQLTCLEPDYERWIDVRQIRRMSRIIKMGVTASLMALKQANLEKPDAIITATAYGCLEDTATFLTKMVQHREQALNPTPFMQSTHNTIGSQIALLLQCMGYNQTYTQGAFSFESALLDAMMQAAEDPQKNILVGGVDEITANSHAIQSRFGVFRRKLGSTLNLFKSAKSGTVNGEGAVFFVLSGANGDRSIASVEAVKTFYKPDRLRLLEGIQTFIKKAGLRPYDIDLVLVGKSGDMTSDQETQDVYGTLFKNSSIGLFKHLCGEYPTASAFALWLGARILQEHHIPEVVVYKDANRPLRNLLIYNPYFRTHHSLILLKSCRDII